MEPKHVLVGVSGGISAYKACDLVSKLTKAGYMVKVVMSEHAKEFVSSLTLAALSKNPVYCSEFHEAPEQMIPHIALAAWADVFILAPCTANVLAKAVHGIADDLLTSVIPALTVEKIMAPAMNVHMYENPVTQHNLQLARQFGWHVLEPEDGLLACGDVGKGRLPKTEVMLDAIAKVLDGSQPSALSLFEKGVEEADQADSLLSDAPNKTESCQEAGFEDEAGADTEDQTILLADSIDQLKPLKGLHILVSAGPTQEHFDPVRYMTNRSTGKQGYAIAKDAVKWGGEVVLVSGPCQQPAPDGVKLISAETALEMQQALESYADWADFIIMAAAVADYRPKVIHNQKVKKSGQSELIEFVRNPDILKGLGAKKKKNQVLCGFAMETENLDANAKEKLQKKNCDLLIANNLTTPGAGFAGDTNVVTMIEPDHMEHLKKMSKEELGYVILARMLEIRKGERN